MDALELLSATSTRPGSSASTPPASGSRSPAWCPMSGARRSIDEHGRIERIPYELCVLRALRDALRRREIYV